MKLMVVTGRPFNAVCTKCKGWSWFGEVTNLDGTHAGGFADLDGKAFEAYYCRTCGDELVIKGARLQASGGVK